MAASPLLALAAIGSGCGGFEGEFRRVGPEYPSLPSGCPVAAANPQQAATAVQLAFLRCRYDGDAENRNACRDELRNMTCVVGGNALAELVVGPQLITATAVILRGPGGPGAAPPMQAGPGPGPQGPPPPGYGPGPGGPPPGYGPGPGGPPPQGGPRMGGGPPPQYGPAGPPPGQGPQGPAGPPPGGPEPTAGSPPPGGTTGTPPGASTPPAGAGGHGAISQAAVSRTMEAARRTVLRCLERANSPGPVTVLAEVEADGHVRSVRLSGSAASTAAGACIEQAIFDVRFQRFTGQTQIVTYTFAPDLAH